MQVSDENKILMDKSMQNDIENKSVAFSLISSIYKPCVKIALDTSFQLNFNVIFYAIGIYRYFITSRECQIIEKMLETFLKGRRSRVKISNIFSTSEGQ